MRVFYIFQINADIEKVTKDNPYELFHTLEVIYYRMRDDVNLGFTFMTQLVKPIKVKELDIALFKRYKENYFYMKYRNTHSMHDVYRKENTKLTIYKTYIKLETDVIKPRFLEELQKNHSLFVCDFESMDYFWLDSLSLLQV